MYAQFDSTATQPTPVTGWHEGMTPACNLVAAVNLLPLTQLEWDNRQATPYVQNGILVATPAPTTAQLVLAAKTAQSILLSTACQSAIFVGVPSSALGAVYTYPCKPQDQSNLSASVLNSLLPNLPTGWTTPIWCMDASNVWTYAPHTIGQVQQAGSDVKAAIVANLTKNDTLQKQVAAALNIAGVQAVTW